MTTPNPVTYKDPNSSSFSHYPNWPVPIQEPAVNPTYVWPYLTGHVDTTGLSPVRPGTQQRLIERLTLDTGSAASTPASTSAPLYPGASVGGIQQQTIISKTWNSLPFVPGSIAYVESAPQYFVPDSGYLGFVQLNSVAFTSAGTFGGSETVVMTMTFSYNDGSVSAPYYPSATADGTTTVSFSTLQTFQVSGKYITKVAFTFHSSISSSAVTATATATGMEF
jgi:hypothetical protein